MLLKNRIKISHEFTDYRLRTKEIKYWDRIERLFIFRSKKCKKFIYTFKHKYNSYINYDDEFKISAIADKYGYEIIDEQLTGNKSIYTFIAKGETNNVNN